MACISSIPVCVFDSPQLAVPPKVSVSKSLMNLSSECRLSVILSVIRI